LTGFRESYHTEIKKNVSSLGPDIETDTHSNINNQLDATVTVY